MVDIPENLYLPPKPTTSSTPRHHAHALMAGGTIAEIVLDDEIYVLRLTKSQKLILTK